MVNKTHNHSHLFSLKNPDYVSEVLRFTRDELVRDLGLEGDITTKAVFSNPAKSRIGTNSKSSKKNIEVCVIAKDDGVVAGEQEIRYFLTSKNNANRAGIKPLAVEFFAHDGDRVRRGACILKIVGNIKDILGIERVVLNLLGRMCGVATQTRRYVETVRNINSHILVVPTRKTLYGLLDKRACSLGGAGTHRLGLYDAILIKDNHLDLMDRNLNDVLENSLNSIRTLRQKPSFFEVEIESKNEALIAAHMIRHAQINNKISIPCFLLLDNQSPAQITAIINALKTAKLRRHILLEASGGITLKNIARYAKTDVNIISIGALTHSAPHMNLTLQPCADAHGKLPVRPSRRQKT